MELMDELKLALFNLVKLKDHKNEKGKDEFYTEYQTKMWLFAKQVLNKCGDEPLFDDTATLPIQNVNVSALSALYDKRLEYEYQIENFKEGSKERIEIEAKFNAIYEAECIVKEHSR